MAYGAVWRNFMSDSVVMSWYTSKYIQNFCNLWYFKLFTTYKFYLFTLTVQRTYGSDKFQLYVISENKISKS